MILKRIAGLFKRPERKQPREKYGVCEEVKRNIGDFENYEVMDFWKYRVTNIEATNEREGKIVSARGVIFTMEMPAGKTVYGMAYPGKVKRYDISYLDSPAYLEVGDTVYLSNMVIRETYGLLCLGDLDHPCGRTITSWNQPDLVIIQKRHGSIYLAKKLYG